MTHAGPIVHRASVDDASSVFAQTRSDGESRRRVDLAGQRGRTEAARGDARVQHVNDWHNNGNTPGIICTRSHFCGQTGFSTRGGFRERAPSRFSSAFHAMTRGFSGRLQPL